MPSSQHNTCSALQRSSQGVQPWNPEQTPLTQRVGQLVTIQSEKETHDPCADFAAHGRPGLSNRECHWIAPVLLAAVQPGPWLRPATSYSPYRTRQTCQRDKVTGQPRQTKNKRIQGQANLQKIREGREEVTVAGVWVLMGPAALCNP